MSVTAAIPKASLPLEKLRPEHEAYLAKRGILAAAKRIGVLSTTDRRRGRSRPVHKIALQYPRGWLSPQKMRRPFFPTITCKAGTAWIQGNMGAALP